MKQLSKSYTLLTFSAATVSFMRLLSLSTSLKLLPMCETAESIYLDLVRSFALLFWTTICMLYIKIIKIDFGWFLITVYKSGTAASKVKQKERTYDYLIINFLFCTVKTSNQTAFHT